MPFYNRLRWKIKDAAQRQRAARNLIALRDQLDRSVPPKDAEDNLLLATWNIRDFGKPVPQDLSAEEILDVALGRASGEHTV